MKLTYLEADILLHRLSVPDCIAEALADTYGFDVGTVADTAEAIERVVSSSPLLTAELLDLPHAVEVLIDAVDGSTYEAAAEGELEDGLMTLREFRRIGRAGRSLAEKIGRFVGRDVVFAGV